ncbi:ras-related protein Rab-3-like [Frieseomelitta varia]|uniref:ras-related protein Rab-3-like n=1 Tax=Frieseomelitta varia TaxID=561572 RepID=UPI001CB680BE|nr:ras-related protein Rab-3-like [Frieseomelitta varia]
MSKAERATRSDRPPVKDSVFELRTRMARMMSIVDITPHNRLPMAGQDPKFQKEAADQNFDYMFKLLIIGNSSVGKTSFLFRYADDSFTSAFVSTVGIDFKVKTVFRHDKRVKLQIWNSGRFADILIYEAVYLQTMSASPYTSQMKINRL